MTQYTVTYPSGDYTNFAGLSFQLNREIGITLKGKHLQYPRPPDDGKVGNNGFQVQMGYPTLHQMYAYDFNGAAINDCVFDFTDFELTMTNAEHESRIEFVRGKFVFPTGAYKRLFGANAGSTALDTLQVDANADVTFANGTAMVVGTPSITNRVLAKGGKLTFSLGLQLPMTQWQSFTYGTDSRLLEFASVDGGSLKIAGAGFGSTKSVGTTNLTVRLLADNARLSCGAASSNGAGNHEIVLKNGATGYFDNAVVLGRYASTTGRVAIADSTVVLAPPNLAGGEWVLGGASAEAVAGGAWGELTVTNSTLLVTNQIAVTAGRVSLVDTTVELGYYKHPSFSNRDKTTNKIYSREQQGGTSSLAMDGVAFKVHPSSTTAPFGGFTTATVGSKGVSVEAANDLAFDQPLANAVSATAKLTLTGGGTKTFTAALSVSTVDVRDGNAVFSCRCTSAIVATNGATVSFGGTTSAEYPLAGLTIGSDASIGYLKVQPNEKIYVADGTKVSLKNLKLVIDGGTLAAGETVSLVCGGTTPQSVKEAWMRALVEATFDSGYTWGVSEKAVEGGTELVIETISDDPLVITVDSGKDVRATNIYYSAGQVLKTVVATDAELELDGKLGFGRLWQSAGGRTRVTGTSNELLAGLTLDGGALEFATPASIGTRADSTLDFKGGALVVDGAGEIPGITSLTPDTKWSRTVFKTDGDIAMALPLPVTLSGITKPVLGKIAKLGDGRLTFLVPDGEKKNYAMGWGSSSWTSYDAANGQLLPVADQNCASFDVTAGTLSLKNVGSSVPVYDITDANVGICRHADVSAGPICFEVDHVSLTIGYGNNQATCSLTGGTGDAMPTLSLKNNATFSAYFYNAYDICSNHIDNSVLSVGGEIRYSDLDWTATPNTTSFWHVVNGGRVYTDSVKATNPSVSVYDRSTLALNDAGDPIAKVIVDGGRNNTWQQMTFRNGSRLAVSYFGINGADQSAICSDRRMALTFDDSEWYAGTGARALASSNIWVEIAVTGGGLRLNPPADATWTLYTPVTGDAGIVKGGAGTLVIDRAFRLHAYLADPVTLAYAGRTTVTGGLLKVTQGADAHFAYGLGGGATLDLDGAAIDNADLAVFGDGTVRNATLTRATLRPTYADGVFAQLTLGANAVLDGRTVVDFSGRGTTVLSLGASYVLARWTETRPDVSQWRGVNLGNDDYRMRFVAQDDGTITATCVNKPGLVLILK